MDETIAGKASLSEIFVALAGIGYIGATILKQKNGPDGFVGLADRANTILYDSKVALIEATLKTRSGTPETGIQEKVANKAAGFLCDANRHFASQKKYGAFSLIDPFRGTTGGCIRDVAAHIGHILMREPMIGNRPQVKVNEVGKLFPVFKFLSVEENYIPPLTQPEKKSESSPSANWAYGFPQPHNAKKYQPDQSPSGQPGRDTTAPVVAESVMAPA